MTRRGPRLLADVAAELHARALMPSWSWGFGVLDREADMPVGNLAYIAGGTGSGKSSIGLHIARHHERTQGPALYVSAELDAATAAARVVSQVDGTSWLDVLRDRSGRAAAVLSSMPRFRIDDDAGDAWADVIDQWLREAAVEHPGLTPLVVVDYLQRLKGAARDPREQASEASNRLRVLARDHRATIVAISKVSRDVARKLRAGKLRGAEALEAGAESNAIEFDGAVVLVLGKRTPVDRAAPSGPMVVEVSIAKTRFGHSDKVVSLVYDGRSGRFTDSEGVRAAGGPVVHRDRMHEVLRGLTGAVTKTQLAAMLRCRGEDAHATVKDAIERGAVVVVDGGKRLIPSDSHREVPPTT